jgi:hypothetical protein
VAWNCYPYGPNDYGYHCYQRLTVFHPSHRVQVDNDAHETFQCGPSGQSKLQ